VVSGIPLLILNRERTQRTQKKSIRNWGGFFKGLGM